MTLKTLENDLADNARHLCKDLGADIKAEAAHIVDPAQCGNIVRKHFDGLVMTLLLFIALFIGTGALAIFLYTHR